ncbi:hypothetical protein DLAC_00224 [Tieghemostelium lacteum]|uniref:Ankyrin repeat-containing protein n=1 Tax=Tieghemostelium lacteum TaxID=361077 RepID=A0A152A9F5_TIELA|nr:hypothetical protein DLAC_00224 [Tieghemostelium lacteum]|eukprot:KYR02761.1 hypothetical protein DLAC_00224 [Tieghemostelium lacteum]
MITSNSPPHLLVNKYFNNTNPQEIDHYNNNSKINNDSTLSHQQQLQTQYLQSQQDQQQQLTNYQLYQLIFLNKYLCNLIYKLVKSHNEAKRRFQLLSGHKYTILKFNQINSAEWLCVNGHFNLLVYKLNFQKQRKVQLMNIGSSSFNRNREKWDYDDDQVGEELLFNYKSLYLFSRYCRDWTLFLWIYENYREMVHQNYRVFDEFCFGIDRGNLKILEFLYSKGVESSVEAMNNAAISGRLDIVKYLVSIDREDSTCKAVDYAAKEGHLEVVKYLLENSIQNCTDKAIFYASQSGHLEVVKYLLSNRPLESTCIFDASNNFRMEQCHLIPLNILMYFYKQGHNLVHLLYENIYSSVLSLNGIEDLELVRFYCEKVYVPSIPYHIYQQFIKHLMRCLVVCSEHGHLQTVKYLLNRYDREISPSNIISQCLNGAAIHGHLELLKLLHFQFPNVRCTKQAMDQSIAVITASQTRHHGSSTMKLEDSLDRLNQSFHQKQLEIITFLHQYRTEGCTYECMNNACKYGNMELVQFLHQNRTEGYTKMALTEAALNGHLHILQFLLDQKKESLVPNIIELLAARGNRFDIIKKLVDIDGVIVTGKAVDQSVPHGIEQFMYLLEKANYQFTELAFELAAKNADLEKLKILYSTSIRKNNSQPKLEYSVKCLAARNGDLDMLKYLNEHTTLKFCQPNVGFESLAIDSAVQSGSLQCVKYLHYEGRVNGLVGMHRECSKMAIDNAATRGYLNIIKFLSYHRNEGFSTNAISNAIVRGHLEVVKYLFQRYPFYQGSSSIQDLYFANQACQHGHIEIIQFLEKDNSIEHLFTPGCMDAAIGAGQIAVLQYLKDHRSEGCSTLGFFNAASQKDLQCLLFLLKFYPEFCSFENIELNQRKYLSKLYKLYQQQHR